MKKDPLKSMKILIERNGKFSNYQDHEAEAEVARLHQQEDDFKRQEAERERIQKQREEREKENRLVQEEEIRLKMHKLRKEEKEIVDSHSTTLK